MGKLQSHSAAEKRTRTSSGWAVAKQANKPRPHAVARVERTAMHIKRNTKPDTSLSCRSELGIAAYAHTTTNQPNKSANKQINVNSLWVISAE